MRRASTIAVVASAATLLTVVTLGAMRLAAAPADRPDCPGRIECPQTGELICADRCPLGAKGDNRGGRLPACCVGGK